MIGAGIVASFRIVPVVVILAGLLFLAGWYADDVARRRARRDR